MANPCDNPIHLCRIRITRLDSLGAPLPGPDNVYVSATEAQLVVTPNIEAGKTIVQVGGCDCVTGYYRGYDKLLGFNLTLDINKTEWALLEMMLGSAVVLNSTDVVGGWWSDNAFDCEVAAQPNVVFEAWQDAYDTDHPDPTYPYVHWIYPSSYWQIAPHTLQNDFTVPQVTGFTRGNANWGAGIYGDLPAGVTAVGDLGGGFQTDIAPPSALCGYQTQATS